jgi:hypothetical protein
LSAKRAATDLNSSPGWAHLVTKGASQSWVGQSVL